MKRGAWTLDELETALVEFERELHRYHLRESTIRTYVDRSAIFRKWLKGEYTPDGPRFSRSTM